MTEAERQIRNLTIRSQLASEFAARLEMEADGWESEAIKKRKRAVELRREAIDLTVQANVLREGAPT